MIIDAPRKRKQTSRYGNMDMVNLSDTDSELDEKEGGGEKGGGGGGGGSGGTSKQPREPEKPSKKQLQSGWTRLECFRVEKGLLTYG